MIRINLGLDNSPYTSKEDIIYFFSKDFVIFVINKETLNFKVSESRYINPDNNLEVKEQTAVFNVHTKFQLDKKDIDFSIKKLCSIFKQDGIAYNSEILKIKEVTHSISYKGEKYTFNKNYFIF
jgi:hypothetical protein